VQTPPLNDEARSELFALPGTAVAATTNADASIRMTPLTFEAHEDGTIRFTTFENSALVKNLRRDARCSVLIDATSPWPDGPDPGYGIHYWGTATIEGPENDIVGMGDMLARYVEGDRGKARAYAEILVSYGDRVYVRFQPEGDVNWDFRMG
jgi:pyridoxamine 5'-phosphate oxidase-like protein